MRVSYRETTGHATGNATVTRRPPLRWTMRLALRPAVIIAVLSASLVSACSWGANPPKTLTQVMATQQNNLSGAQNVSVTAAAREITGDAAASAYGLTSLKKPGEPGTHVCGYVKTTASKGIPLYVELREASEGIIAERGQIGATPANLAKVRFMCRAHKNW
ncbi:MAG: hypothetical protein ACI89J_000546 [Hyphomicrobiaceae bacterium]|jgi:hypothetical protein